jgi:hypothetical protein
MIVGCWFSVVGGVVLQIERPRLTAFADNQEPTTDNHHNVHLTAGSARNAACTASYFSRDGQVKVMLTEI